MAVNRTGTAGKAQDDRQERLRREVEEAIKTIRHGRVTVDIVGGRIAQVDTTRRTRADRD